MLPPPKLLEVPLVRLGALKLRVGADCLTELLLELPPKVRVAVDWRWLVLGVKVLLGFVVDVLPRPKVRWLLPGCVTVVRVLLWRVAPPKVRVVPLVVCVLRRLPPKVRWLLVVWLLAKRVPLPNWRVP